MTPAPTFEGEGEPDAAAEIADAAPIPDAVPVQTDATPLCENAVTPIGSTRHADPKVYPVGGTGCIGACHQGEQGTGHKLTIGGSVFRRKTIDPVEDYNPFVAGAHIYILDANGKLLDLVTHEDGKFAYAGEVAFPIKTWVSGCPDSIPMVEATTGNCNSGGCHDSINRIYLPNELDPPAP